MNNLLEISQEVITEALPTTWDVGDSNLKWVGLPLEKFEYLTALDKVLGNDYYVFGGAIRDYYALNKLPEHDFDVYITPGVYSDEMLLANGFTKKRVLQDKATRSGQDYVAVGNYGYTNCIVRVTGYQFLGRDVQLIECLKPLEVFSTFDWRVCQFGYTPRHGFFGTVGALKDVDEKTLHLSTVHLVVKTILRGEKLQKRLDYVVEPISCGILSLALADVEKKRNKNKKGEEKQPEPSGGLLSKFKQLFTVKEVTCTTSKEALEELEFQAAKTWLRAFSPILEMGELAKVCRKTALFDLSSVLSLLENRGQKETSSFENSMLGRQSVELEALSDFRVFVNYLDSAVLEINALLNLTLKPSYDRLAELSTVTNSFEDATKRIQLVLRYVEKMREMSFDQFQVGKFEAPYWSSRVGKGLQDCIDILHKTKHAVIRLEASPELLATPTQKVLLVPEAATADIGGILLKAMEFFVTRTNEKLRKKADTAALEVELVFSNTPTDLVTISYKRKWSSCQELHRPTEHNRCLGANIKNTVVAYLTDKDGIWIGRALLRLDVKNEQVFVEPYYGDRKYQQGFEAVVRHYLAVRGIKEGTSGEVEGFNARPYSDNGSVQITKRGPIIRYNS